MVKNTNIIEFRKNGDSSRGYLTAIESNKDIPFDIKRIYYITDVPANVDRGFHSHKNLQQILICVSGSVKIKVSTPYEKEEIILNNSNQGLYIGNMVWREMAEFSESAVLLVLASEYYTEDDYYRDYDEYLIMAKEYFLH